MSCPSCGQALLSGSERCPSCAALVAPAVEGSLAPDPSSVTPPGRGRENLVRELAGRKRERTWKDEVKDRVRSRRQKKPAGLPLFGDEGRSAAAAPGGAPVVTPRDTETRPMAPIARPVPERPLVVERARPSEESRPASAEPSEPPEIVDEEELLERESGADELADLPLHPADRPLSTLPPPAAEEPSPSAPVTGPGRARPRRNLSPSPDFVPEPSRPDRELTRAARGSLEVPPIDEPLGSDEDEWPVELPARPQAAAPLERPALAQERAMAAGLDFAMAVGTAAVVIYFAGRAARVPVRGLLASWPYLLAYLAVLGLVYVGYFTGTTGQTLGKMATGLRVVDVGGRPPGFVRAFLRGALGALGVALGGLGLLPMLFDPARRAFHDRVFRMRVVKR